jgi:hypothetical protein
MDVTLPAVPPFVEITVPSLMWTEVQIQVSDHNGSRSNSMSHLQQAQQQLAGGSNCGCGCGCDTSACTYGCMLVKYVDSRLEISS